MSGLTENRFLDGRLVAVQPSDGFRSGLDIVMLAACVPAGEGDEVLELGCGVGVGSLCLAIRSPACRVTGIDIVPELIELARSNAERNAPGSRIQFRVGDSLQPPSDLRGAYDHVFSNPPFHGQHLRTSPHPIRKLALSDTGRLGDWLTSGLKRTRSGGTFTAILRADRLGEALAHLPQTGLTIYPLWPRTGAPANRAVLQVSKGSNAPLVLLPGLVLHEADGRYTAAAEAVLRSAEPLALASRPR